MSRSRRAHAIGLFGFTILVLLAYDLTQAPITSDRALFIFFGQTVLRGEGIHSVSFFNYPPLGPMIGAASMWVGEWFGVPTHISPRYLSAGVVGACVVLTYLFARRASGRAWVGILAGLTLASSSILMRFSVSGLEPKVLVAFFGLLASCGLQHRRFGLVGLSAAMGALCWQPFALIAAVYLGVSVWSERRRLGPCLRSFFLGAVLGSLPVAVYLTLTGTWLSCWHCSVTLLFEMRSGDAGGEPSHWLSMMMKTNEAGFLICAGVGLLLFVPHTSRRGALAGLRKCMNPRLGGLPLVTPAWILWNGISFDYYADALPFLWIIAFWSAWLWLRVVGSVAARARQASVAVIGVGFVLTIGYGLGDCLLFERRTSLTEQTKMVQTVIDLTPPGTTLATIGAEEFLVFHGRPSAYPFLHLRVGPDEMTNQIDLGEDMDSCDWVVKRTRQILPVVFITSLRDFRKIDCVKRIGNMLKRRKYFQTRQLPTKDGTLGDLVVQEPPMDIYDVRGTEPVEHWYQVVYESEAIKADQ